GAILTIAAHVAAMAPGTNIGAAHPVNLGSGGEKDETMKEKAENDLAAMARSVATERGRNAEWAESAVRESVSASAREALKLKVIDILAKDLSDLIQQLDGMTVSLPDGPAKLVISNPEIIQIKESLREKILRTIADPNIAYILMMIGMTGLYFEPAPGSICPPGPPRKYRRSASVAPGSSPVRNGAHNCQPRHTGGGRSGCSFSGLYNAL
ncbi:MAG: hypothetical protein JRI56_04730, partial [Deltaproteobacteria bacterium]|nr:hypothetical protein [Deltaproteobacteria bacterium]